MDIDQYNSSATTCRILSSVVSSTNTIRLPLFHFTALLQVFVEFVQDVDITVKIKLQNEFNNNAQFIFTCKWFSCSNVLVRELQKLQMPYYCL